MWTVSSRSYIVDVGGQLYCRNRKYLRTTSEKTDFGIPLRPTSETVVTNTDNPNAVTKHSESNPDNQNVSKQSESNPTRNTANKSNDLLIHSKSQNMGEESAATNTRCGRMGKLPKKYDDFVVG